VGSRGAGCWAEWSWDWIGKLVLPPSNILRGVERLKLVPPTQRENSITAREDKEINIATYVFFRFLRSFSNNQ